MPASEEDTLKILIATDNHVGYLEDDPVRGQDSFNTFEEILQLAQRHEVDMILLGGDLFHHNKPSRSCLYQVMRLIRRYCIGDKPSQMWIASDQSLNFADDFCIANYLDPNINVSYPIFSIHGNHDDPSGMGNLCALNLLSVAGLVNYFGKCHNLNQLTVYPVLLQKGNTRVALYGLGNVRDERLHRAWRDGRVKFMRSQDGAGWENAFNLFVLHQNRVKHGPTSYIPEEFMDEFIDLVLWGHEHDCRISPEVSCDKTYITQPGSSIATSLSEGESLPKHVGLLTITGQSYTLDPIRLSTVRPFQFTTVALSDVADLRPGDSKACQAYLRRVVDDLIDRAKEDWDEQQHQAQQSDYDLSSQPTIPLPLIRVRVDYSGGFETFNPQQFGQQFTGRVANPKDILKFQRARELNTRRQKASDILSDVSVAIPERLDRLKVEDLVSEILSRDLEVLPENELENAVKQFVDKDDRDSISRFVNQSISRTQQSIPISNDLAMLNDEFIKQKSQMTKRQRVDAFAREHSGTQSTDPESVQAIGDTSIPSKRPRQATTDMNEDSSSDGDTAVDAIDRPTTRSTRTRQTTTPPRQTRRNQRSGGSSSTSRRATAVPEFEDVETAEDESDSVSGRPISVVQSTPAPVSANRVGNVSASTGVDTNDDNDDDLFANFVNDIVTPTRSRKLPFARQSPRGRARRG